MQIALRKTNVSGPGGDLCQHPGGPVPDPGSPTVGLYGGLEVGMIKCSEAKYRWSIRNDGKGIVVGNGVEPLWALNAEEVELESIVTVGLHPAVPLSVNTKCLHPR